MADTLHKHLLHFLSVLHRSPRAAGIEELSRSAGIGTPRKVYRWQRALGDDLLYFPGVTFAALGLEHLHLFIEEPRVAWERFPYAVSTEWVVGTPGVRTLYLHCIIPSIHRALIRDLLDSLEAGGACTNITSITTRDVWQLVQHDAQPESAPEGALRPAEARAWEIVERLPLLIPVIFEMTEQRRSLPSIWNAIYERLGSRTWEYLPRFSRRLPTNGKAYVKEAFDVLNETGLFRQNIVRYERLNALCTPMFLRVAGEDLGVILQSFARLATTVDIHPVSEREALLRVSTTHAQLQYVFSTSSVLPRITSWYFVDVVRNHQAPVRARFAYELLFDPATTEWLFPREEIIARVYR